MCWAAEAYCPDLEAMLQSVRKNGRAIRFASPELRSDRRLVLEAVRQTGHALEYASSVPRKGTCATTATSS